MKLKIRNEWITEWLKGGEQEHNFESWNETTTNGGKVFLYSFFQGLHTFDSASMKEEEGVLFCYMFYFIGIVYYLYEEIKLE